MANTVTKLSELDFGKLTFSRTAYSYGPSAKLVYVNLAPKCPFNTVIGPFRSPFGISAYDNNMEKLSVSLTLPTDCEMYSTFEQFDEYFRDEGHLQKMLLPAWTPHTPNADYVQNCYMPTLNDTPYGGQLKMSVRLVDKDPTKVRALMLEKRWKDDADHSAGFVTTVVDYKTPEDLLELYPARSLLYVTAQITGVVFSRNSIKWRWEAAHIIRDFTAEGANSESEGESIFTTMPDLSFLE